MENEILKLIKSSSNNENDYKKLEKIFKLYEQLQYATNINQMAEDIYIWLNNEFNIDNLTFSLFDINKNDKEDIFVKGKEFNLDDELSFFFIINTHTNLNATISFCATSKVHYHILEENRSVFDATFLQISPIIQNGILKKNYIDASSLDSVTNVYTRNYLIETLEKHLRLSNNKLENDIYFLMVGVDHFKAITDEFDYDIGDKVLVALAKVIHSNISQFDLVGRLNADEFLITVLNSHSEYEVTTMAEKIIDDFSKTEILVNSQTNQTLKKTICIGLETYDKTKTDIDECIKNADIALYEAKNKGRSKLFNHNELSDYDTIELF